MKILSGRAMIGLPMSGTNISMYMLIKNYGGLDIISAYDEISTQPLAVVMHKRIGSGCGPWYPTFELRPISPFNLRAVFFSLTKLLMKSYCPMSEQTKYLRTVPDFN